MKSRFLLAIVPVAVLCVWASWARLAQAPDAAVVDWLRAHAIRLQTVEARNGFADMRPLEKVVGNARVVSLGEATHGTREFFQLKHRVLEFLATEMGFSIFSIEANMPEAYRINDYVLTGKGDPAALLKGIYFWTWNTEEVLDMIRWMREFNASGKGRVQFTGFDMQTPDVAAQIARDFVAKYEPAYSATLDAAWQDMKDARPAQPAIAFGLATGTFPVGAAAGRQVRYSGYIRTHEVTRGWAGLWWRVDGEKGVLAFDNMEHRGPRGTTDWTRYEISLRVPAGARNISFGVLFPGDGTAWFDALRVELDGVPYADPGAFDFDFESGAVKGFRTGGIGYEIALDNLVAKAGAQSLRMRHAAAASTVPGHQVDPKAFAATCRTVLAHMDASRQAWRRAGAADTDVDWAIQNARIVRQYAEMHSGERTRDQSMADNVKWIAARSPGAKMVLWAHNGHVATVVAGLSRSMGAVLRETFGKQMVVFGFAFNQGSFQAIEPGQGLRRFTVSAAPAGSLDATLAATGIPVLAIDLRGAPVRGPVADWLAAPHQTRSIGSVFSEASFSGYLPRMKVREAFDALLFVEKTTSARPNPPATRP